MGYHFFQRREYPAIGTPILQPELDCGFQILGSILHFGLLLKPEVPTGTPARRNPTPRICFTEETLNRLCEPEVEIDGQRRSHFEIFGPFAIGIDNRLARRLGLCAVLSNASLDLTESVSEKLIGCLPQIHNTLALLAHIESLAHPDHDYHSGRGHALPRGRLASFEVDLHTKNASNRDSALAALERLKDCAIAIEEPFEALNPDRLPFWQLAQFVTLLADLEQDADSLKNKRYLAYYRQREWRIQRTFYQGVGITPISAKEISLVGAHYGGNIAYREAFQEYWRGNYVIGPNEWLLTEVEVKVEREARRLRICEVIDEIIYPETYDRPVRDLVERLRSDGDEVTAKLRPYPMDKGHDDLREHFAMD